MFDAILTATKFEELIEAGEERDHAFKRLAKIWHPDKHIGGDQAKATKVMARLTELYSGTAHPAVTVGDWIVQEPIARGDIANLYYTSTRDVFKIVRVKTDNDLMDRERKTLTALHQDDVRFRRFLPEMKDALTASGRRVNVVTGFPEFIPLAEIADRLHGEIEFRYVVWMMNRLLMILGYVHRKGYVHGAILPSHLLYCPETTELRLVDWCYSTKVGERVPAAVSKYKYMYAPEILKKSPVSPSADLYMAASVLRTVTTIPPEFKSLFEWCVAESPAARPNDAWTVQDRWRKAAKLIYGEPKFNPLTIPVH